LPPFVYLIYPIYPQNSRIPPFSNHSGRNFFLAISGYPQSNPVKETTAGQPGGAGLLQRRSCNGV
jgi:hypothetical protein